MAEKHSNETDNFEPLEDSDLLVEMTRALVDHPEQVRVEEQATENASMMLIHVAPDDRGKVIGKAGVTIGAIRTFFSRVAAIDGRRVFIEVANSKKQGA